MIGNADFKQYSKFGKLILPKQGVISHTCSEGAPHAQLIDHALKRVLCIKSTARIGLRIVTLLRLHIA